MNERTTDERTVLTDTPHPAFVRLTVVNGLMTALGQGAPLSEGYRLPTTATFVPYNPYCNLSFSDCLWPSLLWLQTLHYHVQLI